MSVRCPRAASSNKKAAATTMPWVRCGSFVLAVALGGCVSRWETQPVAPATAVSVGSATNFRVTLKDGSRIKLSDPTAVGDSLIGVRERVPWPDSTRRVAIAVSDIESIAVKKTDVVASAAIGTTVVIAIIVFLAYEFPFPAGD